MVHDQRKGLRLRRGASRLAETEAPGPAHSAVERSRQWRFPVGMLGSAVLFGIVAAGSGIADEPKATVTNLMQKSLGVAEGVEVVSYVVAAPGGAPAVPRHRHYGDEFLFVLEGAVTVVLEGAAPHTVRQGEMFHLPYGVAHTAQNASGTEPGQVLVFHVKEADKPVRVPIEAPVTRDYLERHPI